MKKNHTLHLRQVKKKISSERKKLKRVLRDKNDIKIEKNALKLTVPYFLCIFHEQPAILQPIYLQKLYIYIYPVLSETSLIY